MLSIPRLLPHRQRLKAPAARRRTEPAQPVADEPKVETPPADLKPVPKPEPSQIANSEPETVAAQVPSDTIAAAPKPEPQPEPAAVAKAPEETLEVVAKAPAVPDAKPVEEVEVGTLPDEPKPAAQPEPAQVAASAASEARPEAEKAPEAPKAEVNETEEAAEAPSPEPEPAPVAKASPRKEKPAPKSTPAEKPREIAAARTQGGLSGKPMTLGFGRKPAPAAGKVSSGRYAANVRAAIGRHRPRVRWGRQCNGRLQHRTRRWTARGKDRPLERQASRRPGCDRHSAGRGALPAATRRHQQHLLDPDLFPLSPATLAWFVVIAPPLRSRSRWPSVSAWLASD